MVESKSNITELKAYLDRVGYNHATQEEIKMLIDEINKLDAEVVSAWNAIHYGP